MSYESMLRCLELCVASTIAPIDPAPQTKTGRGNIMRNLLCLLVMSGAFSTAVAGTASAAYEVSRYECEINGGAVVPGAMTPGFCFGGAYDMRPIAPSDHSF
ncbi:hypothetical protein [Nocardia sp. NPDC052316]|uniref:hypothetical protein n=1 Tax=Nocardia sp. NPDC052316 TaxID=3364329 RepID=UPI0037C81615